jgi:cytoplasmic iron level regulating protein YaaA (DUF328/UPF0246 family)
VFSGLGEKCAVDNDTAYCLFISCSQRKRSAKQPVSALELYNGFYYQIIKKLMREGRLTTNIDILIISAKYGLLLPSDLILPYEQKMTACRAAEMQDRVGQQLASVLKDRQYQEIFVNLGRDYLSAIVGFESLLPEATKVIYAKGGIGQRGAQMKRWILAKNKELSDVLPEPQGVSGDQPPRPGAHGGR